MKKLLSLLVMLAVAATAIAQSFTSGEFKFTVTKAPSGNVRGEVTITGASDPSTISMNLQIQPYTIYNGSYYNITAIAKDAFMNNTRLVTVRLPYGVKFIGSFAFQNCTKLTTISVPSSVESFGERAFSGCTALKNYYSAQYNQSKVTYGAFVFPNNSGMKAYFPNITIVTDPRLSMFTIENSVEAYDMYMVDGTVSVVDVPATTAGANHKCMVVGFNPNATLVRDGAYVPTNAISSPTGYDHKFEYTSIANRAFYKSNATKIDLTNLTSVTVIYAQAFQECAASEITLPKNCTEIGNYAFQGCSKLKTIKVAEGNTALRVYDGILYGKDEVICAPMLSSTVIARLLPVSTIRSYAFEHLGNLIDIHLPYGVKTIESRAFVNTTLHSLIIPSSVTTFGTNWMYDCKFGINSAYFILNQSADNISGTTSGNTWISHLYGSTTNLYVPREAASAYKKNSSWARFNINPDYTCAYDFRDNDFNHYTVTSNQPTTINGTYYDGTVMAVHGSGEGVRKLTSRSLDHVYDNNKNYAVTRIDADTYRGYSVEDLTLGNTVSSFATDALSNAANLKNVTLLNTGSVRWDGKFFGNNASGFTFWVRNDAFNGFYTSALKNWDMGEGMSGIDFLAPYIQSTYDNTTFSCAVPVTFNGSGLNAYYVTSGIGNTLVNSRIINVAAGTGVVATGIQNGEIYRLPRVTSGSNPLRNLLVGVPGTKVDVYGESGGYIWNPSSKKFVRPRHSGNYALSGTSYLKIPSALQEGYNEYFLDLWPAPSKKGDVDGNGVVDITDANIIINIILGKESASQYAGRADVDGNNVVDITDANIVLNIILGK